MPGVNPDPRLTAQDRGGFDHRITNASDSDLERFQQVDQSGNVFGGSWNPQVNAAHPEWAGRPAAATAAGATQQTAGQTVRTAGAVQQNAGATQESASARPFDDRNFVAPSDPDPTHTGGSWVSWVDGLPYTFNSKAEADADYARRTSGQAPTPSAAGSAPATGGPAPTGSGSTGSGSTGTGTGTSGNVGANPDDFAAANTAANNAAMIAYYNKRLELDRDTETHRDENEKQRLAQEAARDAWNKTYQSAQLTGSLNGTPTLDATKQGAELTGYVGPGYATQAQQAFNNLPPEQRTGDAAARIWQNVVPGLSAQEAAQMNEAGHQYYAATGQAMPDSVAAQNLSRITGGRVTGTGGQQSIAYQHQQNQDAISALTLLSNLRGPENAFAYANTLAGLPDSVRQTIQAMTQNLPVAARNPAQAGVLGDATAPLGQQQTQTLQGGSIGQTYPLPLGTGPRTQQVMPGTQQTQDVYRTQVMPVGSAGAVTQPAAGGMAATNDAYRMGLGPQTGTGAATDAVRAALASGQAQPEALYTRTGGVPAGDRQTLQQGGPYMRYAGTPMPGTTGAGGTQPAYGPRTQPGGLRPASGEAFNPSQLSPTDYAATDPYAKKVMWAGFENSGGDIASGQWRFQNSLPRAYGPRVGSQRAA